MARPRKQIVVSPEQYISDLAEKQCSKVEISARLGISVDTLDRHYAEIYTKGRQTGKAKLREKIYDVALAGNTVMLIFLAKAMLGLKETSAMELSGPDQGPLQVDDASRAKLAGLLAGIAARQPAEADPGPVQ
jgi:hypothetical protein